MGKPQKIIPIHYQKLVKIFELECFIVKRQKSDHLIMTKTLLKSKINSGNLGKEIV